MSPTLIHDVIGELVDKMGMWDDKAEEIATRHSKVIEENATLSTEAIAHRLITAECKHLNVDALPEDEYFCAEDDEEDEEWDDDTDEEWDEDYDDWDDDEE